MLRRGGMGRRRCASSASICSPDIREGTMISPIGWVGWWGGSEEGMGESRGGWMNGCKGGWMDGNQVNQSRHCYSGAFIFCIVGHVLYNTCSAACNHSLLRSLAQTVHRGRKAARKNCIPCKLCRLQLKVVVDAIPIGFQVLQQLLPVLYSNCRLPSNDPFTGSCRR